MQDKKMKEIFEDLNPTLEQSKRMWQRIEAASKKSGKGNTSKIKTMKYVVAAGLAVAVLTASGFGINAATDGKVQEVITKVLHPKGSQEIVKEAQKIQTNGIEVYASDIQYVDENLLVFGNLRGILVYDRQKEQLLGTIDTQAIDCIYFDGNEKQTCVVKKDDTIAVFNTKAGNAYGEYHIYELQSDEEGALLLDEEGKQSELFEEYLAQWKREQKQRIDTFDSFYSIEEIRVLIDSYGNGDEIMYSRDSVCWSDAKGQQNASFLVIQEGTYVLYTVNQENEEIEKQPLQLMAGNVSSITGEYLTSGEKEDIDNREDAEVKEHAEGVENIEDAEQIGGLPAFEYIGDDPAVKAICEYLYEEQKGAYYETEESVWIPGFVILKQVDKKGEHLVFGNFWSENYIRIGNILESCSGGEMPACFHLRKTEQGYEVISYECAKDGSDYVPSIKTFTRGYPGLYPKFFKDREKKCKEAKKAYLQMYVEEHQLDIQYYKEYGWDPVSLY